MSNIPTVGITMGDGAGIGPEIIVKALAHHELDALCRPVVIGDRERLLRAAETCGLEPELRAISRPSEAHRSPGTIDVIDLRLLPGDLAFGELSPVAGEAAYQYICRAMEFALSGDIQAICTAPINKEALYAAGHLYPGHTELLAELAGVDEVSMLLSAPQLKVIHVTTHVGLLDAIGRIDAPLVFRTIRRGYKALVDAGIEKPTIAVCGINPHAGENGLFGHGEEAEKIEPAVAEAQEEGIDVRGPLPADSAFFLAARGDFDLVVAMYHDQGHGPIKVFGLDAGVNMTVGLPVIRTSVDHGTAFDIAGKGIADERSMLEALRQAALMAPRRRAAAADHETIVTL